MTIELLNATYEEIDKIKNLDDYKSLVSINEKIKVELKDLINEFNDTKKEYEKELDNKYSTRYKELSKKLSDLVIKIEDQDLVKEYRYYEKKVNKYLDDLKKEIIDTVRGEDNGRS